MGLEAPFVLLVIVGVVRPAAQVVLRLMLPAETPQAVMVPVYAAGIALAAIAIGGVCVVSAARRPVG
jgi:hypothetical protein